jgi:hypothetical protein
METCGRVAWLILLVGCASWSFTGCSQDPAGRYEKYSELKTTPGGKPDADDAVPNADKKAAADSAVTATSTTKSDTAKTDSAKTPPAVPGKVSTPDTAATHVAVPSRPQSDVVPATATVPAGGSKPTAQPIAVASATKNAGPGAPQASAASSSGAARKVQLLVPQRAFKSEGPEGAVRVSYDDIDLLKILNMDPVPADAATFMPVWLKGLEGQRIRIRGFMYPTFQQTGIHAFGFARDNQICCFGRNPKIYDLFDVMLRKGVTTDFLPNRPFDVVGVFHIRPEAEDGKLYHLYEIDDATVIAK